MRKGFLKHQKHLERRSEKSPYLGLMIGINIIAWFAFLLMMILLHYARPELITGFQQLLELEHRDYWLRDLTHFIIGLQIFCLLCGAVLLWLKHQLARRRGDSVWLNVFFLLALSALSLMWTYSGLSAL